MHHPLKYSTKVIQGIHIHCAEAGSNFRDPPVILLHGLIDSHRTWQQIVPKLAESRRILMPDLPGHGLSSRPNASYTLEWYSKIMAQWVVESGFEQVDLVGHSLGGGISQMLLLECRDRIRRIGLIASGGLGREISFLLRLASIPYVVELCGQPFMKHLTTFMCSLPDSRRTPDEIKALSAMNAQKGTARAFARTVRDLMNLGGQRYTFYQRSHEVSSLPAIRVFWGEKDSIIPAKHGRFFSNKVDGVKFISFAKSGHSPHHQEPTNVASALCEFLNEPQYQPHETETLAQGFGS